MLTEYVHAALGKAHYEILPANGGYYGEIPAFRGVWANAATLESCREELAEVLEGWILLGVSRGENLPVIDGLDLSVRLVAS